MNKIFKFIIFVLTPIIVCSSLIFCFKSLNNIKKNNNEDEIIINKTNDNTIDKNDNKDKEVIEEDKEKDNTIDKSDNKVKEEIEEDKEKDNTLSGEKNSNNNNLVNNSNNSNNTNNTNNTNNSKPTKQNVPRDTKENKNIIPSRIDEFSKKIKSTNLEKYEDIILDNKDLFIKYYNAVEFNNNLGDGKKYVYDMFIVVAEKKKYIDEDYFFKKLSSLSISFTNLNRKVGVLGNYNQQENKIDVYCDKTQEAVVIHHELMHFIDYCLNDNISKNIYVYNGKFISEEEKNNLSYYEKFKVNYVYFDNRKNTFLVEGGATVYSSKYFNNSWYKTGSYYSAVELFYLLQYIYSEEGIDSVFFGTESLFGLTNEYFTESEFSEFIEYANSVTKLGHRASTEVYSYLADTMIGLYSYNKDTDWKNDKEFCLLLYNFIRFNFSDDYYNKYKDVFDSIDKLYKYYADNLEDYIGEGEYLYPAIVYENKHVYFVTTVNNTDVVKLIYNPKDDSLKKVN